MLSEHRPEKENRSPSAKKVPQSKLQTKDSKPSNQMLNASEVHLLQSTQQQDNILQDLKGTERNEIKQIAILKVKLADKQFQVRKLEEDFAEFKLLSRMQYEKTLKKLRDQLACSKAKHSQEIKKWQSNFQLLTERSGKDCEDFKSKTQQSYREAKEKQLSQIRCRYEAKINSLQEQLRLNHSRTNQLLNKLRLDYEYKIQQLKETHLLQIKAQEEKNQIQIKMNEEICQIKMQEIVQAKEAEVKLVEESKQVTVKKQQKYLAQIGKIQREKNMVRDQLDQQQIKFKFLQKKYENQAHQIELLKKHHSEEIAAIQLKLSQLRLQTEQTIEADRLQVLKEHYEKTRTLEERLSELQQLRDTMISECKQNQRVLDMKFERRESRKEDIEAIREIEYKLAEKQRETNQLYYNLRLVKMQKQNNDKIYTKIFTASKQKRGLSNRNDRDIYSLLKQSHTTDFRHLLKVANKDSKQPRS